MRVLNKSVLAGGVSYPAGAHGPEVEAAVTNPAHWTDDGQAAEHAEPPHAPPAGVSDDQVLQLVEVARAASAKLVAVLVAIAPLLDVEPDDDGGYLAEDLDDAVFGDPEGMERLAAKVTEVLAPAVAEPVDYSSKGKPELEAEVARRNEDPNRADDAKIVVEGKGNKPDLIAALQADDARG